VWDVGRREGEDGVNKEVKEENRSEKVVREEEKTSEVKESKVTWE
jgi:hypothetical protein